MDLVSVIVPIFNGIQYLPSFFTSLIQALPQGAEVILVDDCSTEPVLDSVPEMPNASDIIQIRNDQNIGYSATVNRGFLKSSGDYLVQLNTDLILGKDCISKMIELIKSHKKAGIVGSKLIFPTTDLIQHIGMAFGYHSKRHIYYQLPAHHPLSCKTRPMQILTGATVAMTRLLFNQIGLLDERYFNHNEDIDHCMKAITLGYTNYTCAESKAYHWVSQSGPSRFAKIRESEAVFWSRLANHYNVDLSNFIDEGISYLLTINEKLADYNFEVINLCRSNDELIIFSVLERFWHDIRSHIHHYRQYNNLNEKIWLPMILPYWLQENPKPFIYVVDRYLQLSENQLWFRKRLGLVIDEIIVDLTGCPILVSEFLHGLGAK